MPPQETIVRWPIKVDDSCLPGDTEAATRDCLGQIETELEVAHQRLLGDLRSRFGTAGANELDEAEAAWQGYAASHCALEELSAAGGSYRLDLAVGCATEALAQRVRDLQDEIRTWRT